MTKIYARQEPTTDEILLAYHPKAKKFDTVFYRDEKALSPPYTRIPWYHKNRPIRRKYVILNLRKMEIVWI